jgi:hypothetical protein
MTGNERIVSAAAAATSASDEVSAWHFNDMQRAGMNASGSAIQ